MSRSRNDHCLVWPGIALDHDSGMTNALITQAHTDLDGRTDTDARDDKRRRLPFAARNLDRLAALCGIAWMGLGIESIVRQEPHNYRDALFYVPWVLLLATVTGIHQLQQRRDRKLERVGYFGVVGSMALVIVAGALIVTGAAGNYFAVAMPLWIISIAMFGVATARAGVFPRWVGVGLVVSQPLAIAAGVAMSPWIELQERGSYSGAVAHGAVFLAIAAGVHRVVQDRVVLSDPLLRTMSVARAALSVPECDHYGDRRGRGFRVVYV